MGSVNRERIREISRSWQAYLIANLQLTRIASNLGTSEWQGGLVTFITGTISQHDCSVWVGLSQLNGLCGTSASECGSVRPLTMTNRVSIEGLCAAERHRYSIQERRLGSSAPKRSLHCIWQMTGHHGFLAICSALPGDDSSFGLRQVLREKVEARSAGGSCGRPGQRCPTGVERRRDLTKWCIWDPQRA